MVSIWKKHQRCNVTSLVFLFKQYEKHLNIKTFTSASSSVSQTVLQQFALVSELLLEFLKHLGSFGSHSGLVEASDFIIP